MTRKLILLASLLGLLAGCSQQVGYVAPTAPPPDYLPTVVALTGQAIAETNIAMTQTAAPTLTPTVTEVTYSTIEASTPTPFPTATPTFAPGFTDFAQVRFISPGPMSSVVSPIILQIMVVSGRSELVQIDLLGEDGRILQRDLERVSRDLKGNYRRVELEFETRAVAEKGYIRISSKDEHGRLQVLNTMPVVLYSQGSNVINPIGNMTYERVMIEGLKDGDDVFGGVVNLKGRIWPFNDQPVFVDLLSQDGRPLTSRILNFNGIDTQDFETTLPYSVKEPTPVLLSFHQDNPDIASDPDLKKYIYVYTMELTLNP